MTMVRMLIMPAVFAAVALAQPPDFGPGFGGPPGGFGGPMGGGARKVLERFDAEGKGWLNAAERKKAREYLATQPAGGFGRRGGGFGRGGAPVEVAPGPKLSPDKVKTYGAEPLYDRKVLRTLFLEFEDADWEQEIMDFYHTDVDVPRS